MRVATEILRPSKMNFSGQIVVSINFIVWSLSSLIRTKIEIFPPKFFIATHWNLVQRTVP